MTAILTQPAAAAEALRAGSAVVFPNPYPLTSVVAATAPGVVNTAKGRPADQAVALWLVDDEPWSEFSAALDLDDATRVLVRELLVRERLTLLLPVVSGRAPGWASPATRDGHALVFGACGDPVRPILTDVGHLHVSSANRTGHPPHGLCRRGARFSRRTCTSSRAPMTRPRPGARRPPHCAWAGTAA